MGRLQHNVQIREWLHKQDSKKIVIKADLKTAYNPKTYLPTECKPPLASQDIKDSMDELERKLTRMIITKNNLLKKSTNMTREQQYLLQMFFNHDLFIIIASGKILGLIIMERSDYIVRALTYHLLDTKTYCHLGPVVCTPHFHAPPTTPHT